jgi:hydroxymethylbilane synthase
MTTAPDRIVLASRGSRLATAQSEIVAGLLRKAHDGLEVVIMVVKTTGDRDDRPFAAIPGKGLFTTEVEGAVARGDADIAVHSAKDLTAELAEGCIIACVPERAPIEDVVVGGQGSTGEERLGTLPEGARVGTSSMRRRALLAEARPDLEAVEFRGNLDTRLRKVAAGEVDAAIVAAAGLTRLPSIDPAVGATLAADWWVPPPGQGALAIEALASRTDLTPLLHSIEDPTARAELDAERAFGAALEGGCSVPLGCSARATVRGLLITGFLGMPDGTRALRDRVSGPVSHAVAMGRELAESILRCGGDEILEDLAYEDAPPMGAP